MNISAGKSGWSYIAAGALFIFIAALFAILAQSNVDITQPAYANVSSETEISNPIINFLDSPAKRWAVAGGSGLIALICIGLGLRRFAVERAMLNRPCTIPQVGAIPSITSSIIRYILRYQPS